MTLCWCIAVVLKRGKAFELFVGISKPIQVNVDRHFFGFPEDSLHIVPLRLESLLREGMFQNRLETQQMVFVGLCEFFFCGLCIVGL